MVHQLKIEKEFFEDIIDGNKTFELRVNDRDFRVGDILGLNVIDENGKETGWCTLAEVTYILDEDRTDLLLNGIIALDIAPYPHFNFAKVGACDPCLTRGYSQQSELSSYFIHNRMGVIKDENK